MWNHFNVWSIPVLSTYVVLADGSFVYAPSPAVEMRLMDRVLANSNDWEPLTDWFVEQCVVRDNCSMLSGSNMRKKVYIASCPTSSRLFLAKSKHGLMNVLPSH